MKNRYTINEVLGRGANAITYLATDNTSGNPVSSIGLWLESGACCGGVGGKAATHTQRRAAACKVHSATPGLGFASHL